MSPRPRMAFVPLRLEDRKSSSEICLAEGQLQFWATMTKRRCVTMRAKKDPMNKECCNRCRKARQLTYTIWSFSVRKA